MHSSLLWAFGHCSGQIIALHKQALKFYQGLVNVQFLLNVRVLIGNMKEFKFMLSVSNLGACDLISRFQAVSKMR